ncbi:MAG: hypothetical protein ACRDGN_17890 [bacterium]
MTEAAPALSVIVAAPASPPDVEGCLKPIMRQCRGQRAEVLVTYSATHEPRRATGSNGARVTFMDLSPTAPLPAHLRKAIARAGGNIIAVTEGTCAIDDGWIRAIVHAQRGPHPVVGGAVEPLGLRTVVDWAAYFTDYGQFMLPLPEGYAREIPGNNFALKRSALAQGGEFPDGGFWKTFWCQRLQAQGIALYATPAMVVYYRKSFRFWPYLVHRFHNGRCFGGMRAGELHGRERVLRLAAAPGLPVLFCARIVRAVLSKRRFRREFVLAFPVIVLATIPWALGEFVGYLWGPGRSCRHVR